ncbi:hypothetical protein IWGMT90018_57010 [Mycobacterium kiyosense]|nr:hypothetical protein IWGMT90018_57010 [Mycobacterium kiyosense]
MKQHAGLTCGEKPVRRDAPTGCHAGVTPGDTSHASVTFGAKTGGAKTGGAKAVDAETDGQPAAFGGNRPSTGKVGRLVCADRPMPGEAPLNRANQTKNGKLLRCPKSNQILSN